MPGANNTLRRLYISDGVTEYLPDQAPIIQTGGMFYGAGNIIEQGLDFLTDPDATLLFGNMEADQTAAVINKLTVYNVGGKRTFTADVSFFGWDTYSWDVRDFRRRDNPALQISDINPMAFGYVWLLQNYGYGRPYTTSFESTQQITGSVA